MDMRPVSELAIVWEEPPAPPLYRSPSHYRGAVLDRFRAELLANPGRWALLPEDGLRNPLTESKAHTHARTITKRGASWEGEHPWEAKAVGCKVYVRYLGFPAEEVSS